MCCIMKKYEDSRKKCAKRKNMIPKILTKHQFLASEHKKSSLPLSVPLVSVSKT